MITKELLSKVLKCNVVLVDLKYTESTKRVRYVTDDNNDYYIDVYKLSYLCKEWALNNNYVIESYFYLDVGFARIRNDKGESFEADNEYKAIFKCCEHILSIL